MEKFKKFIIKYNSIFETFTSLIMCIFLAILLNTFILINANVPSGSMENTLPTKSRLFGNRLSYLFSDPKRGDIVIFWSPDEENVLFVKRVVGLPGDTVEIKNGKTYINGEVLQEDYLPEDMLGVFGPYEVPEKSYLVFGDNRNHSNDARFWSNKTFITKEDIVAKAKLMYYPQLKYFK